MTSKDETRTTRKYTPRLPPAERREQILDAVLEVISEQGAAAVSVDGIARKLDFTRPVVYALFTDANHLLRESLKREEKRASAQIDEIIPLGASGSPEDIATAFRAYLDAVLEQPARWRAILLPIGATPEQVKKVGRGRTHYIELLTDLVGSLASTEVDAELTAHLLLTLAEEAGRLILTDPDAYNSDRLATFAGLAAATIGQALGGK